MLEHSPGIFSDYGRLAAAPEINARGKYLSSDLPPVLVQNTKLNGACYEPAVIIDLALGGDGIVCAQVNAEIKVAWQYGCLLSVNLSGIPSPEGARIFHHSFSSRET